MKAILSSVLIALLLNGCASMSVNSYESTALTPTEMQALAMDGSAIMAERYPPGKTALDVEKAGAFGEMLAQALRQRGFAIEQGRGTPLRYLVDPLDAQAIRLGLLTPDWRSDALYLRQNGSVTRQNLTQRID